VAVTSAVLDAALCLLLVSASVLTIVDARQQATEPTVETATDPGETAALLSSVTRTVVYDERIERDGADADGPTSDRIGQVRHGTLSELLAFAAVRSVERDGVSLFASSDAVARVVQSAVRSVVGRQTRVVARWDPIHRGHLTGRVVVGPRPPPDTDVHAARVTVPVPSNGGDAAQSFLSGNESETSVETVARRTAVQIVGVLFPPTTTESVLFEGARRALLVGQRYERVGAVYGLSDPVPTTPDQVPQANDRLVETITDRFVTDLRRNDAAVRTDVEVDHVRIVVRTWSR
jgi:hypothetical protein